MQAVREWGIIIGSVMAVIRVIRCNPFSKGGEDPVPSRKQFFERLKALFSREKRQKTDIGE
jgi:putative component of membrane protein insertase Oxa1/YidC/SpoIIIJ protein YidD